MKFAWMHILAMIVAFSSLVLDTPAITYDDKELSFISEVPQFFSNALKDDTKKHSEKTLHIAQDFIPILVIAAPLNHNNSYTHYLPIYGLFRKKRYFLLI